MPLVVALTFWNLPDMFGRKYSSVVASTVPLETEPKLKPSSVAVNTTVPAVGLTGV